MRPDGKIKSRKRRGYRPVIRFSHLSIHERRSRVCPSAVGFADGVDEASVSAAAQDAMREGRVAMIFIETPANPTNGPVDIGMMRRVAYTIGRAQGHTPLVACDTLLDGVLAAPVMVMLVLLVRNRKVMGDLVVHGWLYALGWAPPSPWPSASWGCSSHCSCLE